jgi:hypothetical protein
MLFRKGPLLPLCFSLSFSSFSHTFCFSLLFLFSPYDFLVSGESPIAPASSHTLLDLSCRLLGLICSRCSCSRRSCSTLLGLSCRLLQVCFFCSRRSCSRRSCSRRSCSSLLDLNCSSSLLNLSSFCSSCGSLTSISSNLLPFLGSISSNSSSKALSLTATAADLSLTAAAPAGGGSFHQQQQFVLLLFYIYTGSIICLNLLRLLLSFHKTTQYIFSS